MILFLVAVAVLVVFVVFFVKAVNSDTRWTKSRVVDLIVLILTFVSFIFSVGISGRIAIYVSDYNVPVLVIMGGLVMNLALFFVPALLFIASVILAVRLIK